MHEINMAELTTNNGEDIAIDCAQIVAIQSATNHPDTKTCYIYMRGGHTFHVHGGYSELIRDLTMMGQPDART